PRRFLRPGGPTCSLEPWMAHMGWWHDRAVVGGGLVGREREVSALAAMLADETVRLVTVAGPARVGKTRLAYAVAARLARARSLRCVRVELGPLVEPALVPDVIAAAVGADDRTPGASALEATGAAIGDAPALLVLDNFEHVEAAVGDVATLLDTCPGV